MELELPRLLAPDLPSIWSLLIDLICTHCNYRTFIKSCIVIFCHYLHDLWLGNLRTCCLPWKWSPFLRRPLRNQTLIPRTRKSLGSPLHYQRKLISQKFEWNVDARKHSIRKVIMIHHQSKLMRPLIAQSLECPIMVLKTNKYKESRPPLRGFFFLILSLY